MPQEGACARFPNPFNFGQGGGQGVLFPRLAVIPDRKAVDLLLNGGNQRKRLPVGVDGDFPAVLCNGPRTVFVVLDHTEQRNVQPGRLQNWLHRRHMPLAAVQQD